MIDFNTIREISDSSSTLVGVCNNNYLVTTVNELRRELVDMAFDTSWLGKEEVADHRNIVRHLEASDSIADRSSRVLHSKSTL